MVAPASRFSGRLPPDLKARAEAYADRLGVSLNALLAFALNDYLNAREGFTPSLARKRPAASIPGVKGVSPLASASRSASVLPPAAPKVGRNDPCPCQSGRKFKHCCGGPNAR
jgi:hypothetical protein